MVSENIVPAAERSLRLVELLLKRPEGWTPQELLLEMDLSRSSLFVLLRAFKTLGCVEQAGKRGRYIAGPRLNAWRAPQPFSNQDLLAAFYQEAEVAFTQVSGQAGKDIPRETLALVLPTGGSSLQIAAQVEGSATVRVTYADQMTTAELPSAAQVLDPHPAEQVARHGYSFVEIEETISMALPLCRDGRTPEAALLLAAPAFRWDAQRMKNIYLDSLREMAARLSHRMGAPFYAPYRVNHDQPIQSASSMAAKEIGDFLKGPYPARLACIRPDGKPHVIPVWQEWDGENFAIIAWRGSQWADYVLANPSVSLTVDEPWMPLRRVVVSGCASPLDASSEEIDRLLQRVTRRYLGHSAASGLSGQVRGAFRIQPETMRGWQGLLQGER